MPDCSDHGTYDLETGACVCEEFWTGPDCSQGKVVLHCYELSLVLCSVTTDLGLVEAVSNITIFSTYEYLEMKINNL